MTDLSVLPDKLLTKIYGDLAKPGVSNVGKAIGNLLWACTRIVNTPIEIAKIHCEKRMEKYAAKLSQIDEGEILPVVPELGVPIINALSYTSIEVLQNMYVELLSKASCSKIVEMTHPGFIQVIQSLSSDDVTILEYLRSSGFIANLSLQANILPSDSGFQTFGPYTTISKSLTIQENESLYFSNLIGLGLVRENPLGMYKADDSFYQNIIDSKYMNDLKNALTLSKKFGEIEDVKGYYEITDYGRKFLAAVTPLS